MTKTTVLYRDEDFFSNHTVRRVWQHRRQFMTAFMLASDLLCILASMNLPLFLWQFVRPELSPEMYQPLILPVTVFFISIYLMMGLYPRHGVGPVGRTAPPFDWSHARNAGVDGPELLPAEYQPVVAGGAGTGLVLPCWSARR